MNHLFQKMMSNIIIAAHAMIYEDVSSVLKVQCKQQQSHLVVKKFRKSNDWLPVQLQQCSSKCNP